MRSARALALCAGPSWRWLAVLLALLMTAAGARAEDALLNVRSREGVSISYWWMPRPDAWATVLLFSGGGGGIGLSSGQPRSGNFLIRSRDDFARAGLNVALIGNPSDQRTISPAWRRSAEHAADVRAIVEDIRGRSPAPVWLIGTSQGTISAAAGAIALGPLVQGVVLTSTLSGAQPGGSVPDVALERLAVPVLVHQHRQDSCRVTLPSMTRALMPRFTQAPVRRYMEVDGGTDPRGDPCEAFHWHGYIGMEAQAVQQLVDWMRQPVP